MRKARRNDTENDEAVTDEHSPPEVITVSKAAEILTVSKWTIYELIRKRQLQTFKIGARRLIPVTAVHKLIQTRLAAEAA